MTDQVERAHAEQLMAAFAVVLTHPAGFGIELLADLWIDRLEDGRFRVARYDGHMKMTSEELFDDVRSAIGYYLDLRDELQMGGDYESSSKTGTT
jgi:hypothetical protein